MGLVEPVLSFHGTVDDWVAVPRRGVAPPWRGAVLLLGVWVVWPPLPGLLVEVQELLGHLPGLEDAPPQVQVTEPAAGDLAEQAAHPAGLGHPHGDLVLGLDQQQPWHD